uniref:Uncharacterized protein n=1 Tax=Mesocestoides corti TaxID=53468 RepID=A0A5K3G3L4_MESCO
MKKKNATEQALLTIYKPEQKVRYGQSQSSALATPLIILHLSNVSFVGCLSSPHTIGTQTEDWLRPARFNMSALQYVATSHTSGAFHPSPRCWLCCSFYAAPQSCISLVGCLSSSHAIRTQRDTGLAEASVQ